jgi:hypothetical protein
LSLFAAVNKDIYISKEMIIRAAKQDAKNLTNDARDKLLNTSTTQV